MTSTVVRGLVGLSIALGVTALAAAPAQAAAPKPAKYMTCQALNAVYPHGVGRKGATDKVTGTVSKVTDFTVRSSVYKLNKKLDLDKDGIACEKA
jgi:hypothetical protein